MTQDHPITPPPELMQQWASEFYGTTIAPDREASYVATQAARWGADQQLEKDAEWLDTNALFTQNLTISPSGDTLRQAMRPKPPSLKEQALEALDRMDQLPTAEDQHTIRRALEQLND